SGRGGAPEPLLGTAGPGGPLVALHCHRLLYPGDGPRPGAAPGRFPPSGRSGPTGAVEGLYQRYRREAQPGWPPAGQPGPGVPDQGTAGPGHRKKLLSPALSRLQHLRRPHPDLRSGDLSTPGLDLSRLRPGPAAGIIAPGAEKISVAT